MIDKNAEVSGNASNGLQQSEAAEAPSTSIQQLKAEIAAIADSVEDYTTTGGADAGTIACIVRDLRRLSAV